MSKEKSLAISYCRKSTIVKDKSLVESVDYQQQTINQYANQNEIAC
jgi:tetrahydromethanopterin S-methyltransferase subunit F